MTLNVIFKVIGIGYNPYRADLGRVIKWQFSQDFGLEHIIFKLNIEWRRTGDSYVKISQNCRFFKYKNHYVQNYPFYPIEYQRRIRNYMTLKMKVKVILNQLHLKTIEWAISDSLWVCETNRLSICNFTRHWLYPPLPICINCRALAWEWVYVYKLAFFFWLSPRTYHFLFEKRLIKYWRYFWRNIAPSLILERKMSVTRLPP